MAKVLLGQSKPAGNSLGAFGTKYGHGVTSVQTVATVDATHQRTFRTAGVLSNLYIRILTNSANTHTYRTRKNTANGGQSVSITGTGEFQDASGTDTVAAGDTINTQFVTGNGTITFSQSSLVFAATTNTACSLLVDNTSAFNQNETLFMSLAGSNLGSTTEANHQCLMRTAGTLKNLHINVTTNSKTTTTTYGIRIGGVSKTLSISLGAGVTGILEDTANSDAVSSGDLVNYFSTTGATNNTLSGVSVSVEFVTTDSTFVGVGARNNGITINASATAWCGLGGAEDTTLEATTESNVSTDVNMSFNVTRCWINVSANTIVGAGTFSVRKNQAAGNNSASITGLTTGIFEDASSTDSFVSTDEFNYQVAGGAAGTSMTIRTWGSVFTNTDAAGGDPEGSLTGGKLIRGGLLQHGVLVGGR